MTTPRDIINDVLSNMKDIFFLHAPIEQYIVLTITKIWAFLAGLGVGYYLFVIKRVIEL